MADDEQETDGAVPPAGEGIHLPDPSFLPVIVAAGTTIALLGVVINWVIAVFGVIVTVVAIARWIGQTREEMAELPLDHGH